MRFVGYRSHERVQVGALSGESVIPLGSVEAFWSDPYAASRQFAAGAVGTLRVQDLDFAPPVLPSARVLCVGLNYAAHVDEGPFTAPDHPTVFGRWTSSLAVSGTPLAIPPDEAGLDWEGELLAVVGRPLLMAGPEAALDAVFAYGSFNDITARRAQKLTTQWTLGKNADNSGAMSDLVTADDVGDPADGLRILTTVNGTTVQDGSTADMLFGVGELLAFLSRTFRLNPGDLIATGTPNGVGYARTPPWLMQPGDEVEVTIEKVGSVRTPVEAWPT